MNTTMKHEKDNRKRIEYDAVGFILDEDLAKTVEGKVKDLVTDICNNVGKDYFRQDLKVLIMDYVGIHISNIQLDETMDYFKEKIEQQENK
jgi:hypothetical protein